MGEFQHGLCSCMDDIGSCVITYFLPCITAGQNAEAVGESCLLFGIAGMTPILPLTNGIIRGKIRERYGIEGSLIKDIICHWCCSCCALIQDAQEIKSQGGSPGGMAMSRE